MFIFNSSIGKKFVQAVSGAFLIIFMLLHTTINFFSVIDSFTGKFGAVAVDEKLFSAGDGLFKLGCDFMSTPVISIMVPVLALGAERGERDAMNRPPERCGAALGRASMLFVLCSGAYICGVTVGIYAFALNFYGVRTATTMAFLCISFCELFHAFNVRMERRSAFGRGALSNKVLIATAAAGIVANVALCLSPFSSAFGIASLSPAQWIAVFALSLSVIAFGEIYKALLRFASCRRRSRRAKKPLKAFQV